MVMGRWAKNKPRSFGHYMGRNFSVARHARNMGLKKLSVYPLVQNWKSQKMNNYL